MARKQAKPVLDYSSLSMKLSQAHAERDRLKARIEKLEERRDALDVSWFTALAEPFAEWLRVKGGYARADVAGPFGLGHRVSIFLYPEGVDRGDDERVLRLEIEPGELRQPTADDPAIRIVDRSVEVAHYARSTIDWMNGFNCGTKPVPYDADPARIFELARQCDYPRPVHHLQQHVEP